MSLYLGNLSIVCSCMTCKQQIIPYIALCRTTVFVDVNKLIWTTHTPPVVCVVILNPPLLSFSWGVGSCVFILSADPAQIVTSNAVAAPTNTTALQRCNAGAIVWPLLCLFRL